MPSLIRTEVVAALPVVALLAPKTVAAAQIAGVPLAQGLAAAPQGAAFAVPGRSRRLIVAAVAAAYQRLRGAQDDSCSL